MPPCVCVEKLSELSDRQATNHCPVKWGAELPSGEEVPDVFSRRMEQIKSGVEGVGTGDDDDAGVRGRGTERD